MIKLQELFQNFKIWCNWTLKLLGLLLIYHCIALKFNAYTPFRVVELNEMWAKQEDLAYAMMAAQEDILQLSKKK